MESCLHPFKLNFGDGVKAQLPTSPEFSLKKLWLSGLDFKLFELSASFRDKELGGMHLNEFTMLEFYVAGAPFEELSSFTGDFLCAQLKIKSNAYQILSLNELFKTFLGFELKPDSDENFLKEVSSFHNIKFPASATWSDLFHVLFIEKIEPVLSKGLLAIKNYPPQLSALAKINKKGWSERVEFYYQGLELGNGYNELLDADEVLKRWNKENELRLFEGFEPHPLDQEFIEVHRKPKIESGVGMAIGLERLFWLTQEKPGEHIGVWPFNF